MHLSLVLIIAITLFVSHIGGKSAETRSPAGVDNQNTQPDKQSSTAQALPQSTGAPLIIINNPAPTVEQNRSETKPDKWPPTLLEIISVIIAGGAFYIAWRTLAAVRRQADIAERTLKTAERAWLSVTFNKPFKPQHGTVNPVIYSVKNTGKTAAFLKVKQLSAMPWPTSVIPERPLDPKPMGACPNLMVIFPDDVVELEGIIDIDFRGEFFNEMIAGRGIFDVYGYIAYDDIFNGRHITRFCYAFDPGKDIYQGTGRFEYIRDPATDIAMQIKKKRIEMAYHFEIRTLPPG